MTVVRLLLVLLLVFDQVGSPLHEHHHDSGIDAAGMHLEHAEDSANDSHLGLTDPAPFLFHAVIALKSEAPVVLGPADAAALFTLDQFPLAMNVDALLDVHGRPPPRERTKIRSVYRSLPPDGRAPPLHA